MVGVQYIIHIFIHLNLSKLGTGHINPHTYLCIGIYEYVLLKIQLDVHTYKVMQSYVHMYILEITCSFAM